MRRIRDHTEERLPLAWQRCQSIHAQLFVPHMSKCCRRRRYEDDKDEGEWFLYTGSGGRDLSGNKRTNKARPR